MAITPVNHFDSLKKDLDPAKDLDPLCLYIFRLTGEISNSRGVCHRFKQLVENHAAAIESDIINIFGNFSLKCVVLKYAINDSSTLEKIEDLFQRAKNPGLKLKSTCLRTTDPYHLIHLKPLFEPYVKLEHMMKFWRAVYEKASPQLQNMMNETQNKTSKIRPQYEPLKIMVAMKKCLNLNYEELAQIEDLSLSGQSLCFIPKEIGLFINLKSLDLSDNRLHKLPVEFAQLKNLQMLNLSQNRFTSVPDVFNDLKELQVNINDNRL